MTAHEITELEISKRKDDDNAEHTKTGAKWIHVRTSDCSNKWQCSVCGGVAYFPFMGSKKHYIMKPCDYKYCPWCGIKMEV